MNYHEAAKGIRLINLNKQLKNPTLVRTDINLPMDENGKISEDNLRLQVAANNLKLLSFYSGIVLYSHQGRPIRPPEGPTNVDYEKLSMKQHARLFQKLLPTDIDVDFVPYYEMFTSRTKERIEKLKPGGVLLLDNIRFFEEEYKFDKNTCSYIEFFKSAGIKTCINDAMPAWHRAHSSMMCLPYTAKTYIGMRSSHELKLLNEVMETKDEKGIIVGGIKPKWKYLLEMSKDFDIYTGGGAGQVIAKAKGYDLGGKNEDWIRRNYTQEDIELAEQLVNKSKKSKREVATPVDFMVLENGETYNVYAEEMARCDGVIRDIGNETVDLYAERLQSKEIRIRAGPVGVFEEGYDNGIKLTRRILGEGLMFLGGDTSQEIIIYDLLRPILDAGGNALVSGGAFLHGLAGGRFPSVDLLIELYS